MPSRLEFRILGPLMVRVDGVSVPIGGPKQRALLALLLLSANRAVSRDRLIAEIFAEQSVNSADHALRNHVSRLRKVLSPAAVDGPRLVARAPGYLLRVEPGELDLEQFERLVADGRESLAAGDPEAAAESLRAAEHLWQGLPLADLEFEPFARIDVERLEELRLAAVEERIDAELLLGRQLALVAEVEALSAEHPYRERFRAQLMLALYRSGRQAEGLEVYRRTRTLLRDELGLEPGTELQELERAILTQDPALALDATRTAEAAPISDACPYKGLAPFEAADTEFFFGRERLVTELVSRIETAPLLALVGPSGSGKSSLLRAGLLPALARFEHVLVRPGDPPVSLPATGRVVIAVDQLEELFVPSVAEEDRRAFVDALVEAAWDPEQRAVILISLRADFFERLAPYVELADLVGPNHVLLGPMTVGELRRAIEGPAERAQLDVEPALVDALVDDVAGEVGGLPLLSTALVDLWQDREGRSLTLAAYTRAGGVRGAVGRHAEAAFRSLDEEERAIARRLLLRLVAGGDREALTRRRATREELGTDDPRVAAVLAKLIGRRLLVSDETSVELVHEALLERWPRFAAWLDEDAQGRRLHVQLAEAATAWNVSGCDAGELYRGARLAAALEWAGEHGQDVGLNRMEREFLDESRASHLRATRRLRALLGIAAVLLVAALAAGALALVARSSANHQATAAIAQRLGAQALAEPRLDRALLLARAGVELDDTLATRSNLLAVLVRSPAALAVLHGGGTRVLDDALSTDGRLLAVRADDGSVSLFDTSTLREEGSRVQAPGQLKYFGAIVRPVRALAFSPDGRTLAVGDSDGRQATLTLVDLRTHRRRAVTETTLAATSDVLYAPDGRTLVTAEIMTGRYSAPPIVLATRRSSDGSLLRRSRPIAGGRLIGFALGGRRLLVTSGETESFLLDPRSFARLRTFRVAGVAALTHDGMTAAFGRNDGSLTLVALRTGTMRALDGRAPGRVTALAFSRDDSLLATASDDGTVEVWNVATRKVLDTFHGHAAAALGVVFSRDGATLYSGSSDGSVIVWDVAGSRGLGRQFRFSSAQHGAATAVAVSPDGSRFVTSPARNRVTIWGARDLARLDELRGPCGNADSVAWSHDGRLVACAGDAHYAVVWSVRSGRVVDLLGPSGDGGTDGVAFSPDDRLIGTAAIDGHLRVYHVDGGRLLTDQPGDMTTLQDLDFSSDGRRVAAAGLGQHIVVWDVARKTVERQIDFSSAFLSIRFSPDGKQIATGDFAGDVDFWDPASGRQVGPTLTGQNGLALSVTYDPAGREVVTTSTDGKFRLWDLASGKLVGAPLPGADTGGWGTFFPDGRQVIAVFDSGAGVVWNVDPAAWKTTACRVAHRNLTRSEWRDFVPERGYRRVC